MSETDKVLLAAQALRLCINEGDMKRQWERDPVLNKIVKRAKVFNAIGETGNRIASIYLETESGQEIWVDVVLAHRNMSLPFVKG